jgi:hypothetical protein
MVEAGHDRDRAHDVLLGPGGLRVGRRSEDAGERDE